MGRGRPAPGFTETAGSGTEQVLCPWCSYLLMVLTSFLSKVFSLSLKHIWLTAPTATVPWLALPKTPMSRQDGGVVPTLGKVRARRKRWVGQGCLWAGGGGRNPGQNLPGAARFTQCTLSPVRLLTRPSSLQLPSSRQGGAEPVASGAGDIGPCPAPSDRPLSAAPR